MISKFFRCGTESKGFRQLSRFAFPSTSWPHRVARGVSIAVVLVVLSACKTTGSASGAAESPPTKAMATKADTRSVPAPLAFESSPEELLDPACEVPGELVIHYINVGQGASTFIQGPDGTSLLYDFGDTGDGPRIVEYLKNLGISAGGSIDYAILSHRHLDHYFGYRDIVEANVDVRVANYDSEGSTPAQTGRAYQRWWRPAGNTSAGTPVAITPGESIDLGCGASAFVAAANGVLYDGRQVTGDTPNVNDRSIFLLITYGDFQMTLDGDLGAGKEACTGHHTGQAAVQPAVMRALIRDGIVDAADGVDVMHVSHHGSESSTSAAYFNLARPTVAVISVGIDGKNYDYGHPRASVVDTVLLGPNRPSCVTAPPVWAVFQTEDGLDDPADDTQAKTSNAGMSSGNIVISTDGATSFQVWGDNRVAEGTQAEFPEDEMYVFALSQAADPPLVSFNQPTFAPFFDTIDNPRPVDVPAGSRHDVTPPYPAVSGFDRALLDLCGAFGSPVADARQRLRDTLLEAEHAGSAGRISHRLEEAGVYLGEPVELAETLSILWTQESGFQHVFCGERTGTGIGGLHFAARYLELQLSGQAGVGRQGAFEVLPGEIYTLPVAIACGSRICSARKKGYGLLLSGEDLFVHGTQAWAAAGQETGKFACRYTYDSPLSGQPQTAVFVMRDQGIRTFYPVVLADESMDICGGQSLPAAPMSMSTGPADEDECGE